MKPLAVKPAAVMRIALAVCCIVAGVVGYRMLVAASPAPSPRAAFDRLRQFVARVLNNVPNAALQEIHVARPAVNGNVLDARVRFELVYRSAQP
ncbi:hypothetical protein WJ92_07850 [Burkholderia ubonensis]|uniref:hypothetical protein n=1 Tax=Burkholderia ubonensis TaxID=101571 RepID=UPI000756C809|nr:hypothetical protein [Burkholderia ubonensis]KVP62880.1 hypothetical protein WJ92_07850 [Burkholderia ubonensis]